MFQRVCLTGARLDPIPMGPAGRTAAAGCLALWRSAPVEESPGSMEARWRLTAAGGDPRESATENKPPPVRQR